MKSQSKHDPKAIAAQIVVEIEALPLRDTPNERAVRRKFSRELQQTSPETVLAVAHCLLLIEGFRWAAYELVAGHKAAFACLGEAEVEEFGQGINSWWTVDAFARTLSGPIWLKGQVSDALIQRWAHSEDLWQRRAALVSTVALNMCSHGGYGDVPRTLAVCRVLVEDHEDMVVKALSWALRELVVHDPQAVKAFLAEHEAVLAGRVKREVIHKLQTGLKNPRRKQNEGLSS